MGTDVYFGRSTVRIPEERLNEAANAVRDALEADSAAERDQEIARYETYAQLGDRGLPVWSGWTPETIALNVERENAAHHGRRDRILGATTACCGSRACATIAGGMLRLNALLGLHDYRVTTERRYTIQGTGTDGSIQETTYTTTYTGSADTDTADDDGVPTGGVVLEHDENEFRIYRFETHSAIYTALAPLVVQQLDGDGLAPYLEFSDSEDNHWRIVFEPRYQNGWDEVYGCVMYPDGSGGWVS